MTQKKSTPKKKSPSKYDEKFSIGGTEKDFFKALRESKEKKDQADRERKQKQKK